ncbi:MAG: serine/threonine-protein kinase [Polyangiales bacterium]
MALAEDDLGLVGACLDGRYRLERAVARGGFAVVYRATHAALDRSVAVKVLHPARAGAEDDAREVAQREARLIARLEHPAIVRVLDVGVADTARGPAAWMAMEWLDGRTLAAELRAQRGHGPRSPAASLARLAPAFEAIAHAHAQGVSHRDLKPANLFVLDRPGTPGDPGIRVLDFGIAKEAPPEDVTGGFTTTASAVSAFSLPYASPEQLSRTRTGPWTDVHALALMLTELLIDRPVFHADDPMVLHQQVLAPVRPTPARFGVDVGAWEPVLARALSLRPTDRYADAGAFLAALRASVPEQTRALEPDTTQPQLPARPPRPYAFRVWHVALPLGLLVGALSLVSMRASPPASPPRAVAVIPAAPPPAPGVAAPAPARAEPTVDVVVAPVAPVVARPVVVRRAPRAAAPSPAPPPAPVETAPAPGRRVRAE